MKLTNTLAMAVPGFTCTITALPTKSNPTYGEVALQAISIYHTFNGKIEYDVNYGRISKTQGSGDDLTVLATFDFPSSSAGKKCEFIFETDNDPIDYYIDGPYFDVFESDHIVTQNQDNGPTNNIRQRQLGRLKAVAGGNAEVQWTDKGFTFDCPAPGQHAYEFVPTGDQMEISWNENTDGAYFRYY